MSRDLANQNESQSFWRTAFAWRGSATPIVMPRLAVVGLYGIVMSLLASQHAELWLALTPFEYLGVILGLLLVMRVNAGNERWWEARKIWGAIVNQSRNLAIICSNYVPDHSSKHALEENQKHFLEKSSLKIDLLRWIAIWPYTIKESLRGSRTLPEIKGLAEHGMDDELLRAVHMPTYVGSAIAGLLHKARGEGMDGFAFLRADQERSLLIDAVGACERILKTPIPYVLAIKSRRFIVIFLALLPFGLYEKLGLITPLVTILVAYPLLALDQIGLELQNPFSKNNLSHLPLDEICLTIERNINSLAADNGLGQRQAPKLIDSELSGQHGAARTNDVASDLQ